MTSAFIKTFSLPFLFLCTFAPLSFSHATATQECKWHAAYFDVMYINNYGSGDRAERFVNDAATVMNVVIRIDSLLKNLRHEGRLKHFVRWQLIDDYARNFRIEAGSFLIEERKVFLRITDSIAINRVLKKLWGVEDVVIDPSKRAGMWLFSLHVGLYKTRGAAQAFIESDDIIDQYYRPDSMLLWLTTEGDLVSSHHFYQHETDGYWHTYTGLYLTTKNVLEAQRLLLEHNNLKTTITSHYITPAIIKKYVYY